MKWNGRDAVGRNWYEASASQHNMLQIAKTIVKASASCPNKNITVKEMRCLRTR